MSLLKKMFKCAYIPIVFAFGSNSGKLFSLLNGNCSLKLQNSNTRLVQKTGLRFFRGETELGPPVPVTLNHI